MPVGFRRLISFSRQKAILSIFLIVFSPLPFCGIVMMGFAPPLYFLLVIPAVGGKPAFAIIALLLFMVHALFAYFVACIVVWLVKKTSHDRQIQWAIISLLLVALFTSSFFCIYGIADVGGGFQRANIVKLFSWTIRGY